MNTNQKCPECGAQLDVNASGGVCPKCLLQQGLANSDAALYEPTVIQEPKSSDSRQTLRDDAPPSSIRYFGDYEILMEIARGGMGIVYKARQVSLNRIVAVKVILSGELASETEVKRFYKEAEAAANLQHPNIVAIHEVGEQGRHYFSMDYVEGADLGQHLRQGPMDPRQAAAVLKKVTEAVAYAHMQGTLHRDLKPSNILLDGNGEPRVTDFGLAKRSADREGATLSGTVLGTPAYMAPEQAAGRLDKIDGRTDVYGLGAVLYAMLTGKAPFAGETALAVMREVTDSPPTAPSKLNPKVPVALEVICLKCLEKNPENRYASAIDLAADLSRFLHGQPIMAKPASALMRAMDRVRQNPWVVTSTLTFLILGLLLGGYCLWDHSQFALWKALHPGQKPVPLVFLDLIGLPVQFHLFGILTLMFYLVFFPPSLYSNFADLKRKGALTERNLKFFAGTALVNMGVAIFVMGRIAHCWIWNEGKDAVPPLFTLLLLPAFWFGAHLLWLAVIEWRGRHFGEQPDEVRAVYGTGSTEPPKIQPASRAVGNLCLALTGIFLMTTDLLGVPKFIVGTAWFAFSIVFGVYFHRHSFLALKRASRVANQLFWFVAILATGYFLALFTGIFFRSDFHWSIPFAVSLLIVNAASFAAALYSARLEKLPRPPRFWNASRFGRRWKEIEEGQSVNMLVMGALAWWSHDYAWVLALALTAMTIKDVLEFGLTPDRRRRKELGVATGLALLILFWLNWYGKSPAFALAVTLGLLYGWLEATITLALMPAAERPTQRWVAVWMVQLAVAVAAAVFYFPSVANLRILLTALPELNKSRMLINVSPEVLGYTGERLIKTYAEAGLTGDGILYFKRMASRFPDNSPGAFKAHWAMGELLRANSKPADASDVYSRLANSYHLIPARHWLLAGPFPAATAPELSKLSDAPAAWKTSESAGSVFSGYLDLKRLIQTKSAPLAKPVVYGRMRILSPNDQEVSIRLGLTGEATGWLNGSEVLRARHKANFNLDNATARASLQKGENILLLRMVPEAEFPGLIIRFADPKGKFVSNVQFGK